LLTIQRLAHQDAEILIQGAEEKAHEIGVPMCIAVVAESGFLIAFKRMDGGKPLSTTLAQDQAQPAAISRNSTQAYNECCVPGSPTFGIHPSAGGRFSIVGGGIPVEVDGALVGAIGLSGGAPEQDIACATAGLNRFLSSRT